MESKDEYTILYNAISGAIMRLTESIEKDKKVLEILKVAQLMAEQVKSKKDRKR